MYICCVYCLHVCVCLVSDALKQLSAIDTLSHSVASLKCSLERIINNRTCTHTNSSDCSVDLRTDTHSRTSVFLSGSAADGCCPVGWELSSSSCYFFSSSVLSWNDSRDWCEKQGSHLAILNNDMAWVRQPVLLSQDRIICRTLCVFREIVGLILSQNCV